MARSDPGNHGMMASGLILELRTLPEASVVSDK